LRYSNEAEPKECSFGQISLRDLKMKDLDHPRESPAQKATRQWCNADLTRRFLEEKRKPPPQPATKVIEVHSTERPKADVTTKFERQFIKDLRLMLEGHTQRTLMEYKLALRARIHRLKKEKLRRLLALQAQREAQAPQKKDLFS
jgi:hypothetical protein